MDRAPPPAMGGNRPAVRLLPQPMKPNPYSMDARRGPKFDGRVQGYYPTRAVPILAESTARRQGYFEGYSNEFSQRSKGPMAQAKWTQHYHDMRDGRRRQSYFEGASNIVPVQMQLVQQQAARNRQQAPRVARPAVQQYYDMKRRKPIR